MDQPHNLSGCILIFPALSTKVEIIFYQTIHINNIYIRIITTTFYHFNFPLINVDRLKQTIVNLSSIFI